jgi:hypothetical protein
VSLQRWKLGSYQLKYNPKADSRSKRATEGEQVSVTGLVSNPNLYYDNNINFAIDLYDKPTYYEASYLSTFTANKYAAMTEKKVSGSLYCLRLGAVDIIYKDGTPNVVLTHSYIGAPIAIAHLDDKIALLLGSGSNGSLYITDENLNQISKYTITDPDYLSSSSMAWDGGSYLYILNKYGRIYRTDISNGDTVLVSQFDDFTNNKTNLLSVYKGMHIVNGFIGFIKNITLTYLDSGMNAIYGNDIPNNPSLSNLVNLSYGTFTKDFCVLGSTNIIKLHPNICGIDIESIKNELKNGVVVVTDDKGAKINVIISSVDITRKRNKQDARFEVTFSGRII